jgi:hypothetical protein
MARKRYKPEEIVAKLRQVDVLVSQGSEHGGRNPPDRRQRGDVLSVAPGVWRAKERAELHSISSAVCMRSALVTVRGNYGRMRRYACTGAMATIANLVCSMGDFGLDTAPSLKN